MQCANTNILGKTDKEMIKALFAPAGQGQTHSSLSEKSLQRMAGHFQSTATVKVLQQEKNKSPSKQEQFLALASQIKGFRPE